MNYARCIIGFLVGIAIVIAAHVILDIRENRAPNALRRNALVPAAERASTITITRSGMPPTRLARDGTWKIVAPFVAAADPTRVLRLTDMLAYAPIDDEMTDAELLRIGRTRNDFGLDRPRLVVSVGETEQNAVTVSFGASTPAGNGIYATVGNNDTVYVVATNAFAAADQTAATFRQHRLFAVRPEDITGFDMRNGTARFIRIMRDGETWKLTEPRTGTASTTHVRDYLNALLGLSALDFVWPAGGSNETELASASLLAGYGLDAESAVSVTLKDASEKDYSIAFGHEVGKGRVYALALNGTAIVTVPTSMRDRTVAGANAFVDPRLFPMDAAAIYAIAIAEDDNSFMLSREKGGAWRIDAPVSAPADAKAVDALLEKILALKVSDTSTNGVRVSVGTQTEPALVSRQRLLDNVRLEDCRAKEILQIDPKSMKRIVVTDGERKPIALLRNPEKGSWSVESSEKPFTPDANALAKLADTLNPLRASRIVRLKVTLSELGSFGLGNPLRTIAVDLMTEGAVRRNILIGDVTDGGRFATLGSSDAVFVISTDDAAALLTPLTDLSTTTK